VTLGLVSGGGLLLFDYPANLQSHWKKEIKEMAKKDVNLGSLMDLEFVL
jgi:hypothetical protein